MNWTIETEDLQLHCKSTGSGIPLLLIPGFASGMWTWEWQIAELSRSFQVITFDPRGVSSSIALPGTQMSIELIADDAARLLDSIDIDAAHILGVSFGGFVSQEFALKYPTRIRKLVLASTSFGGANHVFPSMKVLGAFAATNGLNSPERIRQYLTIAFSPDYVDRHADVVERFCRLREENIVPEEVYLGQLESAIAFDAQSRIGVLDVPTLVITGDTDTVVPTANAYNLANTIPNAQLAVIAGSGHMAFVEKAGEFNQIVTNFLEA